MNPYTSDFLETLLWIADSPDHDERPLADATIHQFSEPFRDAVSGFISGFLQYLEACDFDTVTFEATADGFTAATGDTPAAAVASFYAANR